MGTATTSESTCGQGGLTPKLSSDLDNAEARAAEGVVGAPLAERWARELPAPRRATRVTNAVARLYGKAYRVRKTRINRAFGKKQSEPHTEGRPCLRIP